MQDIKQFKRAIRIEVKKIASLLNQLEILAGRVRGFQKRTVRNQLSALNRLKNHLCRRVIELNKPQWVVAENTVETMKEEAAYIRHQCQLLSQQLRHRRIT